jgi:hypothetical protein
MILVQLLSTHPDVLIRLFRVFVPVVSLGVFLDLVLDLPWSGFTYDAYGISVEGSRMWHTFGIERLAGFGRASFETAIILFSLSALYLIDLIAFRRGSHFQSGRYDRILFVVAAAGIVLTTSKSTLAACLAMGVFVLTVWRFRLRRDVTPVASLAVKALTVFLLLFAVLPPILSKTRPDLMRNLIHSDNRIMAMFSASYLERYERMWPEAFLLLADSGAWVTGRGVGGIGMAQKYFEPGLTNAGDNLFVYLLVDFGLVITSLLILVLAAAVFKLQIGQWRHVYLGGFLVIMLTYGATLNVIESPTLMLTIGLLLGLWRWPESELE